jgi:asparagine synthase (glutamine-hydrolysing)
MDTSCATLMGLARTVRDQGYKVAITGEGADEALAGYVWFKTGALGSSRLTGASGFATLVRKALISSIGGDRRRRVPWQGMRGVRTAQQDLFDLMCETRSVLYSGSMWDRLGEGSPYDDIDLTNDRIKRWHPLNQSLYVGYKVLLAGSLMMAKGDRVAMHSSVETRYPFLDEDVVDFCAGIAPEYKLHGWTEKWLLRQLAARTLPPRIANRPKTMFRAALSPTFLGASRPGWVDQLLSPGSLRATGYFDPQAVAREVVAQRRWPTITPRRLVMGMSLTSIVATQLWHHLYFGGGLCDLPEWSSPSYAGRATPGRWVVKEGASSV